MGKISVLRPRSADIHPILMLLTSHRMDCCMLCLRCLERFTDLGRFKRIYILANAVSENHRAILARFAARHDNAIIRDCLPRGLVPAVNTAQNEILAAHIRDVIVKLDEDVFVTPNWLDHLIEGYRHHAHRDDVVLATPLLPVSPPGRHALNRFLTVSYPSERHMYVGPPVEENWVYHRWMWEKVLREDLVETWLAERPALYNYLDYVTINCVIYDRRLIERVHPFPVRPIRGLPTTDELAINRALLDGNLRVAVLGRSVVHHYSFSPCEEYLRGHIPMDEVWRYTEGLRAQPAATEVERPAPLRPALKVLTSGALHRVIRA
jgi:hypothetical protein